MQVSCERTLNIARAYVWSILIWVAFSPVMAGQEKVRLMERGLDTSYWKLLLINGAWCLTAALLTPPIFAIVRRYPISRQGGLQCVAGYLFGAVPYMIAAMCVRWILLPPWNPVTQEFAPRSFQGLIGNIATFFGNQIWDYVAILVAAHAYEYFTRVRHQELERAELQQALAASELQALKSQLHPHFMFNTLQGISTLIDSDKARAKAMILRLSGLLRTALQYGNSDLISLDDELKFLEDYLALEKMRLESRLDLRWNINPDTRQMLVPQMILQPLVENAIVHGVACCRAGGWIEILSRTAKDVLEIQIRNTVGAKAREGMGLGLQNTRARLKYLYADEATFSFGLGHDGVATARLVLPAIDRHGQALEETPASNSRA
jgi:two-component system, LytTR family, sensor kinase